MLKQSRLANYALAASASTLALLIALLFQPLTGDTPFVLFVAAVIFSAGYGGLGPGLLATAIAVLTSSYFLISPLYTLNVTDPNDILHLVLFILVAGLTSSFHHRLRSAQRQTDQLLRAKEESLRNEQEARSEAEAATRAKDEFVAMITHELRTPLTSILGWAAILRRIDASDKASFEKGLEAIERNAKSQAELIMDLMDMSRIIQGKLRLDICPVNLSTIIDASINVIRPAAEAKGIRLKLENTLKENVAGDPDRLQQVFWNLLSNAVKFTPQNGSIEIRLGPCGSQAQVTVTDTGRGIGPDFLPFVFDRFRQARSERSSKHDGLGLGLAIARHLTELHGGTIEAASAGEDLGCTFTIRLPLLSRSAQPAHRNESALRLMQSGDNQSHNPRTSGTCFSFGHPGDGSARRTILGLGRLE